jgi:hypothetical protein
MFLLPELVQGVCKVTSLASEAGCFFSEGRKHQFSSPEYLTFFGSRLPTAIVNCAKWLHP